jgi:tRNA A-37 threonylcarbamoyl transferase component Bud32
VHVETNILPPRYRDPELIGRGGMGEIYRVTDSVLGRAVAVKLLAERYSADEDVRARFTREALAAARLSSEPSIVTIFDVGEWNARPFIVMEYLEGGSLDDAIRRDGSQPPRRALAWLEQAAGALDAAHAAGVVHRDVKPANLLLDASGDVHVADFGIATAAGLDSMTHPGTILGTAGYLAPEQARGQGAGPASDRYALAVVAFELLTGRRPFADENPTVEASAHVHAPIPAASDVHPRLPLRVDDVFGRALAKDPAARYPTCADLVQALRRAFEEEAGRTERVAVAPLPTDPTVLVTETPWRPPRREPGRRRALLPFVLLGLLAAALGGIALASLLGGREGAEPEAPAARTLVTTVVETLPGTTLRETVTQEAPAEEPPAEPAQEGGASGAELNDRGFALMQAGDYAGALPLLEEAVAKLSGSGQIVEAYALYNLAYTRLQLGRCDEVVPMLDRSEQIQGQRTEIDEARARAEEQC